MAESTRSGDVLAGRYRLIDLLSESGGGRFWRAHDTVLERYVALHVISEHDPRADGLVAAARTSAGVLDPRILRVLDAASEDGRCFVVNEWGNGISLDILVTHSGPLAPRRAAWLVADVAAALARAHTAGVTHGRLNPENVLIDRYGSVRLIGMSVDSALHGLGTGDERSDLEDLGGLLYCALTGTWPGPSGSIVPAAPREHGDTLSPRQVVAGVPKPLDQLWREFDCTEVHVRQGRRRRMGSDHPDVTSAAAIAAQLHDFLGDVTGMPEELARAIPPINELQPVWLPAVEDPRPHDASPPPAEPTTVDSPNTVAMTAAEADTEAPSGTDDGSRPEDGTDVAADAAAGSTGSTGSAGPPDPPGVDTDDPPIPLVTDLPTEPGMPVFGGDSVEWLRTRSVPPPPPPPFEDLPERPLFAPDPPDGPPIRRRPVASLTDPPSSARGSRVTTGSGLVPAIGDHWPWGSQTDLEAAEEAHPGRNWLRLAVAVGAALLLLVAIVIAFNLGRGRTPLGDDPDDDTGSPGVSSTEESAAGAALRVESVRDFDPLGEDGEENPDSVTNAIDGDPATTWRTVTYFDQLGPALPALKPGVGLLLDLGKVRTVTDVSISLVEEGTTGQSAVSLFASETEPVGAPSGEPIVSATGTSSVDLAVPATGEGGAALQARYLVLWWTELPGVGADFRAEVAEVVVRGD